MHKLAQPVKLWYWGPYFRHERPQAGRYRQFNQVGVEAIGSDSPLVDAELISLLDELLRELGVPGVRLRLVEPRHRGLPRGIPRRAARVPARRTRPSSGASVRERIDENPLRAFDSKDAGTAAVMAEAPTMLDRLDDDDARALRGGAAAARPRRESATSSTGRWFAASTTTPARCSSSSPNGSAPRRGRSAAAGATTASSSSSAARRPRRCGWAAGIERILLALDERPPEATAIDVVRRRRRRASGAALSRSSASCARAGLRAELDLAGRSLKGQMKQADRLGARAAIVLDEDGAAQLRDMASGEQRDARRSRGAGARSSAA